MEKEKGKIIYNKTLKYAFALLFMFFINAVAGSYFGKQIDTYFGIEPYGYVLGMFLSYVFSIVLALVIVKKKLFV